MSESRSENSLSVSPDKEFNPSVCIASSGPKREIKCNYDKITLFFSDEEGKSAPELFNSFSLNKKFDVYIFLSKDYDFANEDSINYIIDALFGHDDRISAVYTDILANVKDRQALIKPQMMASKYLLNNNTIMNIPFAVRGRALPYFDEKFRHLFLHMGIIDTFQNDLIVHYPRFCFTVNNFAKSGPELNQEMELLKNG